MKKLIVNSSRLSDCLESGDQGMNVGFIGELLSKLDDRHVENGSIDGLEGTVAIEEEGKGRLEPLVVRGADEQTGGEPDRFVNASALQEVAQREQTPLLDLGLEAFVLQQLEAFVEHVGDRFRVWML